VQPRSGEDLRNLAFAERRAQCFEALDDVPDEIREPIDGLPELDEGSVSFFVNPLQPRGDGLGLDEEDLGGLGKRPSSGRLEFEDGHAFGGGVVWPTARVELGHPRVRDADLLVKEFDLLLEPVALGGKAHPGVDAVGGPASGAGDGVVGQWNDVQHGQLDVFWPARRQRHVGEHLITHW